MENVIDVLRKRGFIDAETGPELYEMVKNPIKVYCGFDPTADGLHLGNLIGIIGLAWFQKYGHTPVAIVGGATGLIGDPGGKSVERPLLTKAQLELNLIGIKRDLQAILKENVILLNNFDWFENFSFIDFLRDVGKFFRVGPMLAKDSVKTRLESEDGLSFTEFSYQVLQGFDFLHLYDTHGVTLQIGGSDQWGNITAGVELIRKTKGKPAFGMTFPLLLKSDGQKFGKSEKGAVWLSPEKLSPYEFYQFLFKTPDSDVVKCLKMMTFLPIDEIDSLEKQMQSPDYSPNTLQKKLAKEVTKLVHGEEGLAIALKMTESAGLGHSTELSIENLENMPSSTLKKDEVIGKEIVELLVKMQMLPSKSEARRKIEQGGVYFNNERVSVATQTVLLENLIEGRFVLFGIGKKNKKVIRLID